MSHYLLKVMDFLTGRNKMESEQFLPLITQPTKIKVGETEFEVYQKKMVFTPMIHVLELIDPKTGERQKVRTPHPGWDFRVVK